VNVAPSTSDERDERFQEVVASYLEAVEAGRAESPEALLQRHPDLAEQITAFLGHQAQMARLAAPLRALQPGRATPGPGQRPTPGGTEFAPLLRPGPFGEYELLEEIGRGGMGVVWKARQRRPDRLVALKMVRAADLPSAADVQRFRNEAEIIAALDHPNIVPIYEVGEHDGQLFFSMKLMEGGSLATPRRSLGSPTIVRDVAQLVATVARAVHHAHQRGILHRDLKPANILLDAAGQPHVSDFGLAKRVEADGSLTQSGALVGTPSYMAPEQTSGRKGAVTTATDVHGLGALLYTLLTGRPPFPGDSLLETLERVKHSEPEPPSRGNRWVDRDLETICLKCLRKDPVGRYGSAEALAEDLERWLAGRTIRARPVSRAARAWRWCRRNPAGAGLVAAILAAIVAVAGSAGWVMRDRQAQQVRGETRVREALEAALPSLQQGNPWAPELVTAVRTAEMQVATGFVGAELQRQVVQLKADLKMLTSLEEIRLAQAGANRDGWSPEELDSAYELAFREYGIDVEALDPEEVAAPLGSRAIATHLATGLDNWAQIMTRLRRPEEDPKRRRVLALARAIDPNPWRASLREALASTLSAEEVKRLVQSAPTPERPATLVVLCNALGDQGEYRMAADLLRPAQQRYPADFWINHTLGRSFRFQKPPQLEQAITFYRIALALRPESPNAHLDLGEALQEKGELDEAIVIYKQALQLRPDLAFARNNLGNALRSKGKLDEAIACFGEALRLKPAYAVGHYNLGLALMNKGQLDRAIASFNEALRLNPDDGDFYKDLGGALYRQNKLQEAEAAYRKAITLKPGDADAQTDLGATLVRQNRFPEAEAACRKAIALKPDHARAYNNLGPALLEQKKFREAEEVYRKALTLQPNYASAYFNLGNALADQGKLAAAVAAYHKAFTLQPALVAVNGNLGAGEIPSGVRSKAAGIATMAGCGQGTDAGTLDDRERVRLRRQALTWLSDELAVWRRLLEKAPDRARAGVLREMRDWQNVNDLARVRGTEALARLPEAERPEWQRFWQEVEALRQQAARPPAPPAKEVLPSGKEDRPSPP
jgi:serine/threonine-protein kinase